MTDRLTYWNNKEKGSALPVAINDDGDTVYLEDLCAKLAAYEDAEEQGRLVASRELVEDEPNYYENRPSDTWRCGYCGEFVDTDKSGGAEDYLAVYKHCAYCGCKFTGLKYHEEDAFFEDFAEAEAALAAQEGEAR